MPSKTQKKRIPHEAFRFDAGRLQFAEQDAEGDKVPVSMLARSAQPITHWYWGRIVHDMAGMKLRKETCPIDWCHDYDEIVGYLNDFSAGTAGLTVSGFLVPFGRDRASEIAHKGKSGVPYEASLDWSGPGVRIEEIGEGVTVQVNGFSFAGPGVVVREWPLRAVAVCPYGADSNTRTEFAESESTELEVTVLSSEEAPMAKSQSAPKSPPTEVPDPATQMTEPPAGPSPTQARQELTSELSRFVTRFGAEHGAQWFTAGKTWSDALELHCEVLGTQLSQKDQEITALREKLAAVNVGEPSPVSFNDADKPSPTPRQQELGSKIGDNLARFAAGIKFKHKS